MVASTSRDRLTSRHRVLVERDLSNAYFESRTKRARETPEPKEVQKSID